MKRLMMSAIVAAALAFAIPATSTQAVAASPIFGNAKVTTMSLTAAKQVTAKGATSAYYYYYGIAYAGYAITYAGYAQYYNWYNTYNSSAYYAQYYAYQAYINLYYAYYYCC